MNFFGIFKENIKFSKTLQFKIMVGKFKAKPLT